MNESGNSREYPFDHRKGGKIYVVASDQFHFFLALLFAFLSIECKPFAKSSISQSECRWDSGAKVASPLITIKFCNYYSHTFDGLILICYVNSLVVKASCLIELPFSRLEENFNRLWLMNGQEKYEHLRLAKTPKPVQRYQNQEQYFWEAIKKTLFFVKIRLKLSEKCNFLI